MYHGERVIDVHGHMSTPPHFRAYAYNMIALRSTEGAPNISDQLMQTALDRHLRIMDEREIDVQMISPRPVAMMHWETKPLVNHWTRVTNDVISAIRSPSVRSTSMASGRCSESPGARR